MTCPTIPPHAVSLWLEDGSICMDLPAIGSHLSHRLTFPNNAHGWNRVAFLIQNRKVESKIGEAGDLTQHQVNRQLRTKLPPATWRELHSQPPTVKVKPKDTFSPALRQGARDVLRRLGLT